MSWELRLLAIALVIGIVQLSWAAVTARRQTGYDWGRGPRDEPMPSTGLAGRLERAFANFMESFPFFAAAVLTAEVAGKLGPLTLWGSVAYVVARAVYPFFYAAGTRLRFYVWAVSMVGLLTLVAALFV